MRHLMTFVRLCGASIVLLLFVPLALASECTNAKIKRLADEGRSITRIARICDTDKEEIREIIESDLEETGDDDEESDLLGSGKPVGQCGCWGPVHPSFRQPHPLCRSGYARPSACRSSCPSGGTSWRGVCI